MQNSDKFIGKNVDGYVIEKLIGKGGMGSIYKARDTMLDRLVAIKVLSEAVVDDPDTIKRFEREAKIVAEINHPNIAQVYRIGEIEGAPYYAMELIDGKSLSDILTERGRLGGTKCIDYMIQVAKGLKAAAEHMVIHRDIKPANIMLRKDGIIKVVDFGIAKVFRDDTFKTTTGMVLGTPRYMAPEQGQGRPVDSRSDIYSLGATFYHLLTGMPPFEADNPIKLITKHMSEPLRDMTQFNPNIPPRLCTAIYTMMAKAPSERIQDYTQLIITLENVFSHKQTIMAYRPGEDQFATDNREGKKWLLIGGGIAAAIVVAAIIFAQISSDKSPPEPRVAERGDTTEKQGDKPSKSKTMSILKDLRDFQRSLDEGE